MAKNEHRVLSIGAHPDDADTCAGGLLFKLREAGWDVRLLSLTDGACGTLDTSLPPDELKLTRRAEAANSGKMLGARYDVLDDRDGSLVPSLEARERVIRYIRGYAPDLIITHRSGDGHPDHRATAQLVQDASYLLTVPSICRDVPPLLNTPAIWYWHDSYHHPNAFRPDIIVPMSPERVDALADLACCHECQYFGFMYWPNQMEKLDWPRERQIADLKARYRRFSKEHRDEVFDRLVERFGRETAERIGHVEYFEISEYGGQADEDLIQIAWSPDC